jgi:hypothetical protein
MPGRTGLETLASSRPPLVGIRRVGVMHKEVNKMVRRALFS